jgi:hypothetical protein
MKSLPFPQSSPGLGQGGGSVLSSMPILTGGRDSLSSMAFFSGASPCVASQPHSVLADQLCSLREGISGSPPPS